MNIKKLLVFAPVAVLSLTSCGQSKRYKNEDYQLNLEWDTSRPFRILHLTDLHMSNVADKEKHFDFIRETVNMAEKDGKINLIAITGDMFTFAEKRDANEVFAFFDSLQIPWAPTFGNHDEQVYFTVDWMTSRLNELNKKRVDESSSYCVFKDLQDDDVFGNANYVINLRDSSGNLVERLFFFDSNRYNFGEYRGYDYIHNDQIDWYERQVNTSMFVTKIIPSLAFFHIPFPEFEENYQKAKSHHIDEDKSKYIFTKIVDTDGKEKEFTDHDDGTGDPKKNTGLYQKMLDLGSTNGVFIGHNHTSNYGVTKLNENDEELITLCFGVKSTNRVYCDEEKLGGQVISIAPPEEGKTFHGPFTIKRYFHKYGA